VRQGLLWVLGVWCIAAGPLFAQPMPAAVSSENQPTESIKKPAEAPTDTATSKTSPADDSIANRFWARPSYLLWWVKNAPLPVPVVTTGDPNVGFDPNLVNTVNTAGAIGQPGTQVLLGGGSIHFPAFSGMRLDLGGWLDERLVLGIEGEGFILERSTRSFAAASDAGGNAPLYFPIFSEIAGAERAIPIADPLRQFSGSVVVNSTLQLWGAEVNGIVSVCRYIDWEFTLLAGLRYADLRENLQIHNTTTDLIFGNVTSLSDFFNTTNQFYGGQLGGRLAMQHGCFSLDVTSKVALGSTHEVVDIQGAITQAGPNPLVPPGLGTFPGGLFSQTSNIGFRSADQFAVLGSLQVNLGYEINRRARLFAGYDIMYWNQVVRPGNQVNHNVNLSQNAVLDPNGVGMLVGPAQPAPLFNRSDFWAQGINLGVEFRF
jgi:Putative beta barrel porin-7 (BBP7)